jgi:hypothetical protein
MAARIPPSADAIAKFCCRKFHEIGTGKRRFQLQDFWDDAKSPMHVSTAGDLEMRFSLLSTVEESFTCPRQLTIRQSGEMRFSEN